MYVTNLRVESVRLLADQDISFASAPGQPRMWTVFLGDNGACKTTLLQTIAFAVNGEGLPISSDFDSTWLVRKNSPLCRIQVEVDGGADPDEPGRVAPTYDWEIAGDASGFGAGLGDGAGHGDGTGSGRGGQRGQRPGGYSPSGVKTLWRDNGNLPRIAFLAAFGAQRTLPQPGETYSPPAMRDFERARGIFAKRHRLLATDFYKLLRDQGERQALQFTEALDRVLRTASDEAALVPRLAGIERRGRDGVQDLDQLLYTSRFKFMAGGSEYKLESYNLSDGYQSTIAWVAELIGQYALEHGAVAAPEDMQGVVLLDEIDLHLHPSWQCRLVPILKKVFPKMQFIVTTHSPLVLTGFDAHEIVRLEFGTDGLVHARTGQIETGLMDATEVLDEYFGVLAQENPELLRLRARWAELAGHSARTPEQEGELAMLKSRLAPYYRGRGE